MPISRRRRGRAATRAARSGNQPISSKRKKTNKLYLSASILIAVLVIASFAFASISGGGGGSSSRNTGSASGYVDGIGVQQNFMATAIHLPETETVDYSTIPSTSGDHWSTPQACGFYEDGLPDERITHNLEHGNIVVSYNLLGESQVDELKSVMGDIGLANVWGVTRAYDKLETGQVAFRQWPQGAPIMCVPMETILIVVSQQARHGKRFKRRPIR